MMRARLAPTLALIGSGLGCVPGEIRDRHAAVVETYLRTPAIEADAPAADPERALGPPDGRTLAVGRSGYVVLRFFRAIPDGPGPDLRVYEVGPDGARGRVAVSADGATFFELPVLVEGTTTELDLVGATSAPVAFVRIRGVDDLGVEPGFDLDAVEALH
jgi:hypothetical protein